jgi:DNA polymerase elongation subunit (family B)
MMKPVLFGGNIRPKKENKIKILLLDIETAPNLVHVWGLWQQNVHISQIMDASYVMCWAAKWLGEETIYFDSVHQSRPKRMLSRIHMLLTQADAVIHYNGTRFDIPTLNKEFLMHGMPPPSTYKQIDLLATARGRFRFPSNKLDYIAQAMGVGKKHEHAGHALWVKCMAGDDASWKEMEAYNKNDVVLLEEVYNVFLPWIKNHPNLNIFNDTEDACPNCGGHNLRKRGFSYTIAQKYQRYACRDCGTWSRSRTAEKTKVKYVTEKV